MRLLTRKFCLLSVLVISSIPSAIFAAEAPKYGPAATVLSVSHDYFRHAAAPDFWALMPYYAAQMDGSACSVASVSMLVNAGRAGRKLGTDDELVTQKKLVEKVKNPIWHKMIGGYAITLDALGPVAREALEAYGVDVESVDIVRDADTAKLHRDLIENEKSAKDFIVANFDQKVFTGDTQVGHVAPIGAYDAKNRRVLILDPDREWYEPYWVSEETLHAGMATRDPMTGKSRGYIHVHLKK